MKAFFAKIKEFVVQHKVWTSVIAGVMVLAILAGILLPTLQSSLNDGKCKVSFETNGGKAVEAIWVNKGEPIPAEQLPSTTKDGHRFYGWFTDEALSLQYVDAAVTTDMTLYAGFSVNKGPTEVEYPEVYIGTVEPDFALAVASSEKLTNDNIAEHIVLTVHYGKHEDGTPITLDVKENGQGKYLVSANYASPGNYAISIVSGSVSIDAENAEMEALGLSKFSQKITFTTSGDNVEKLTYSDAFSEISSGEILAYSETAVQVAAGTTLSSNDVISLPGANDFGFVKVVKEISAAEAQNSGLAVAETGDSSKFYSVARAKVNEVYEDMDVYKTEDVDPDLYLTDVNRFAGEMAETLKNDPKVDAFTTLLLQGASYTPEYQKLMSSSGAVALNATGSAVQLAGTAGNGSSALGDIKIDINISTEKDPDFSRVFKEYNNKEFFKVSLSIYRQSSVTRRVGADLVVTAKVTLDYYIHIGSEGKWVEDGVSYDFRGGVVLGTHTRMDFEVSLSVEEDEIDITESLRDKLKDMTDAEAKQVMSLYEALVPSSDSQMVDIYRKDLLEVPAVHFCGFQLSVPVELVISVDFRVALSAEFSAMRLEKIGVEGNTGKLTEAVIYHEYSPTYTSYTVQIQGKIELRAGLAVGVRLTFVDEDLAYIQLSAQAGVYLELHGMGYATNVITDGVLGACGGAYYFETGFYISIDFKAELFSLFGGQVTIWDDKFPVLEHGNKELLYGFADANAGEEIVFSVDGVYLQDIAGMLDVYTYDITRERSDMKRVDGSYMIGSYLNASFDRGIFKYDNRTGKLYLDKGAIANAENETATMILRYEDYGLAFGECIYKTVKVRFVCDRLKDLDPELLSKTCTVTLKYDGIVCKTYEYPYGSAIPSKYTLKNGGLLVLIDGKLEYVHRDIPDEIYKGYSISEMEFSTPGGYITEDIVLENGVPTEYVKRDHTFNYIDSSGCWVSKTITLKHCEVPDLSELEAACPDYLRFVGWNTEIVPNRFRCIDSYYPGEFTARYGFTNVVDLTFVIGDGVTMRDRYGRKVADHHFCLPYSEYYEHYLDYTAEKEGYNFIGWKCTFSTVEGAIGQTYNAFSADLPVQNFGYFTFDPVFEQKPCAITFQDGNKTTTEYYNAGDVIELPNMQLEEECLVGWSSQNNGDVHRITYTVTGNDTLTARYEKDVCFVIFDLNGGYFPDSAINDYILDSDTAICPTMYVVKGDTLNDIEPPLINSTDVKLVFSHWSHPIDQPITADTTFTAIYKEVLNTFTVTYDLNGGKMPAGAKLPEGAVISNDGSKISFTVTEGAYAPNIENPILVKGDGKDYEFVEWTPALEPVTADITYTAVYGAVKSFTVTFDLNGGKMPSNAKLPDGAKLSADGSKITVSVTEGAYAPDIETPILVKGDGKDYVFVEWTPAFEPVTADVTYKAVFEELVPVGPDNVVGVHHKLENGILTIYGKGSIMDYYGASTQNRPWDNDSSIKKIVIEDGILSIGAYAFWNMPSVTEVQIAESVETIGIGAFSECAKLQKINLPSKLTQLGNSALEGTAITSLRFPAGITVVPDDVAAMCTKLTQVTFASGTTKIGSRAFQDCTALTSVTLPSTLKELGEMAFVKTAITSITIPSGVTKIGSSTFYGCTKLSAVRLHENITSIDDHAFRSCTALRSIALPEKLKTIGTGAFSESGLVSVTIPEGVTTLPMDAFSVCENLVSVTIPKSVTTIEMGAFYSCPKLTEVSVPAGCQVGWMAFDEGVTITYYE